MAATFASEPQWFQAVKNAFPDSPLPARILQSASINQDILPSLFSEIAQYVLALRQQPPLNPLVNSKKRKLEGDDLPPSKTNVNGAANGAIANSTVAYECADVSFQIPARKKLRLQIVADTGDATQQELRLVQPTTGNVEYALPVSQIDEVFCLPVPDKQQRQWNFLIFPAAGAISPDGTQREQVVFTMNENPPTSAHSASYTPNENDTYITVTELELARMLQPQGKHVIIPNANEFASSIVQAHRKGERAYHVNAHKGSKEGYLFFLQNGIVFGFKKPLSFFPFSAIESISYTSVLQRTFNIVIAAVEPTSPNALASETVVKETEFGMLDQADFSGIDEYVKRHGLNDASMAAERRAKVHNVNKARAAVLDSNGQAEVTGEEAEVDRMELQKAEQQLQDEEDEEEEDYEASGGESDGEGDYSSEEEEDAEGDIDDGESDEEENDDDEEGEPGEELQ